MVSIFNKLIFGIRRKSNVKPKPLPRDAIQSVDYVSMLDFLDGVFKANRIIKLRIKLILFLLYNFGMRIDETRSITKQQLIELYENGFTNIIESKTGRSRIIVLESVKDSCLLEFIHGFAYNGFIMKSRGNKVYSIAAYNRLINGFLKEYTVYAKLNRKLRSHSFRIGLVTDLLSENQSPEKVRQFVGHSNVATTLRYSRYKASVESLKEMVKTRNKKR